MFASSRLTLDTRWIYGWWKSNPDPCDQQQQDRGFVSLVSTPLLHVLPYPRPLHHTCLTCVPWTFRLTVVDWLTFWITVCSSISQVVAISHILPPPSQLCGEVGSGSKNRKKRARNKRVGNLAVRMG
jgi:hypothetical protein